MKKLRTQVGLVFQYPEHQLFEVDVLSRCMFRAEESGIVSGRDVRRGQERHWNW